MFALLHTDPDKTTSAVTHPVDTKDEAARAVRTALQALGVPMAGIVYRPIAKGLMESPCGETVLGYQGHNFTIEEV